MAFLSFETSTQLAANATYDGAANGKVHDIADSGAADSSVSSFGIFVSSDQAGTAYIDSSFNGALWRVQGSVVVSAGVPADLSVPIRQRYYRVRYVNGGTATGAGNFAIHSSFLSASPSVAGAGGGGGGGAATIADGSDVAEGAKADAAYSGTGAASVISILKGIYAAIVGTLVTRRAQATITQTKYTFTAGQVQNIVPASATANGARILNFTSGAGYLMPGVTGTPASGAPSDYIPAMGTAGPGQYETPYAPVTGLQLVSVAAGDYTIETW